MFRLCTISFSSNVLNIGWFWMEWPLHETAFSFSCHAVLISIAIKKKNLMVFKNLFYINYQKDASIQKNWTDDHWESAVVKQAQTCASSAYNRVMFKTSQQFTFHLSGSCNYCVQPVKHGRLSGWHWRPWRGGTVRWEMIGKSNGDFLTRVRYQEIALTRCSFSIKNFLLTLWLPLVSFALFLFCRHSLPYLLVLTFQFLVVCTISLSSPPIHTPARSIHTTVVPTGIVIPPPQRRLNDFILPCLCLLLLMMRLVPSCFDVDYQSLPLCVGNEGGKITCEEFKGSRKSRLLGGVSIDTQAPPFLWAVSMFPPDQCAAFLKPLLSNDSEADLISQMLLRRCRTHWHPTKDGFPFLLFQRSDNCCFHVWCCVSLFVWGDIPTPLILGYEGAVRFYYRVLIANHFTCMNAVWIYAYVA